MPDPRNVNCRKFEVLNDKVVGVELQYREMPHTTYQLVVCELIDEEAAKGNIAANYLVHNAKGFPVSIPVRLAWPWPEYTTTALSGNPNNQHMIYSTYEPPNIGPLCMFVSDANGNPISDIIGGIGLPFNRHVCYNFVWVERGFEAGTGGSGEIPATEVVIVLKEMLAEIKKLNQHLGV